MTSSNDLNVWGPQHIHMSSSGRAQHRVKHGQYGHSAMYYSRRWHGYRLLKKTVQNGNLRMTASLSFPAVCILQCFVSLPDDFGLQKGSERLVLKGAALGYGILCDASLSPASPASKGTASSCNALQHPLPVAERLTS